jgi:hypothetical protein
MALRLTELLKEMSTRNISGGGKGGGCLGVTTLPRSCADSGSRNLLEPSGPVQACNGIAFYCLGEFQTSQANGKSFNLLLQDTAVTIMHWD